MKAKSDYHTDFICICSAEGKAQADALMKEVKERLALDTDARYGREVTDADFLDQVVWSLSLDFNVMITGIPTDQWHAVKARCWSDDFETYVECDKAEHGIAATWKAFADRAAAAEAESESA